MNHPSVTKFGYLRQILRSIRKHRGEPALIAFCLLTISVVYVWAAATLDLRGSDITRELAFLLVGSFLPFVAVMLLLVFSVAAWRLYRSQQIAIRTQQTLLDLNAMDRTESEEHLRAQHVRREERLHGRYEADVTRLKENMAALTAGFRGDQ